MKRTVRVEASAILGEKEMVVGVRQGEVARWAMEIILLLEGLVETTTFRFGDGVCLTLAISTDHNAARALFAQAGEGHLRCVVARCQAAYVHATLLRAYRDQAAEVDHVHMEGRLGDAPFDITLMFDVHRPPMTSDDARRAILGSR